MGGNRDASGYPIYKLIHGIYYRILPYKTERSISIKRSVSGNMIEFAKDKEDLKRVMKTLGMNDSQLQYIDEIEDLKTSKKVSMGLADMTLVFGLYHVDAVRLGEISETETANTNSRGDGEKAIVLNKNFYTTKLEEMHNIFSLASAQKYKPKNVDEAFDVRHEFAHLLQRKIVEKTKMYPEKRNYYKERNILKNMISNGIEKNIKEQENKVIRAEYFAQQKAIQNLFRGLGDESITLQEIAEKLTGNKNAYASKNWFEAHADCVADYITNGKKASSISIAYVHALADVLQINLE